MVCGLYFPHRLRILRDKFTFQLIDGRAVDLGERRGFDGSRNRSERRALI